MELYSPIPATEESVAKGKTIFTQVLHALPRRDTARATARRTAKAVIPPSGHNGGQLGRPAGG